MKLLKQVRKFQSGAFMVKKYMKFPKSTKKFQNLIKNRCMNLGMKEFDYVIGNWAKKNANKMD